MSASFLEQAGAWEREREKADVPVWLKENRRKSLSRFREAGIPSLKDEEWKYTDITPLTARRYHLAVNAQVSGSEAWKDYISSGEINLVFVNGFFSPALSYQGNLPAGVQIAALSAKEETAQSFLREFEARYRPEQESAFTALNKALGDDGALIRLEAGAVCEPLIHIVHVTSAGREEILTLPRSLIVLGKSSDAAVMESHIAVDDTSVYFADALTDIFLAENAVLDYAKAQRESLSAYHIGHTRVWQERNSSFSGFSLDVGGALTRNNVDVAVAGEGASAVLNGFYTVGKTRHVDNHTSVDHRVPYSTSNQLYKGILQDAGRAVFNGKIFVRPAAQQTNSYQLNKNLLLGKDCRVDTKPQLEIFADDVKCTHGAAIGQLDEDELFYLRTRCIPRRTAVRLLVRGFAEDLLSTLRRPSVVQKCRKLLEPVFETLECV